MAERKRSKRYRAQKGKIDISKALPLEKACEAVVTTASAKFDESVELAINLGVDPTKAEQAVRGSVSLPHGLGKKIRVAVFAKGEKATEAQAAGADIVGAEDLAEKIKGGFMEFDSVIATPDMMAQVGKVGKVLGPRGLMPSPKTGTVTQEVGNMVRSVKAGRAEFRVDKAGVLHVPVGKASFGAKKIYENAAVLMQAVNKAKPATSKGVYLESAAICLTMGPAVKVDLAVYRAV